jgi:hypothetical protein
MQATVHRMNLARKVSFRSWAKHKDDRKSVANAV